MQCNIAWPEAFEMLGKAIWRL